MAANFTISDMYDILKVSESVKISEHKTNCNFKKKLNMAARWLKRDQSLDANCFSIFPCSRILQHKHFETFEILNTI